MDDASPLISVSSCRSPVARVNVASGEGLLQCVFKPLFWGTSVSVARGELAKQCNLWQAVVLHPGDMTSPAQLGFQQGSLDAGDVCLLEDFHIGDVITPVDLEE